LQRADLLEVALVQRRGQKQMAGEFPAIATWMGVRLYLSRDQFRMVMQEISERFSVRQTASA
jgi:hypothetical protein